LKDILKKRTSHKQRRQLQHRDSSCIELNTAPTISSLQFIPIEIKGLITSNGVRSVRGINNTYRNTKKGALVLPRRFLKYSVN
jgi:hypothetical protein